MLVVAKCKIMLLILTFYAPSGLLCHFSNNVIPMWFYYKEHEG